MNDGPGLSAWDLARERREPLDAAYRERIARELARENEDPQYRALVEDNYQTRRAYSDDPNGPLNASGRGPRNLSGICGSCGRRAHRYMPRMTLALRQFRAGEWKP